MSRLLGHSALQNLTAMMLLSVALMSNGGAAYGAGYKTLGLWFFIAASIGASAFVGLFLWWVVDGFVNARKRHSIVEAIGALQDEGRTLRDGMDASTNASWEPLVQDWEKKVSIELLRVGHNWRERFLSYDRFVLAGGWRMVMNFRLERLAELVAELDR